MLKLYLYENLACQTLVLGAALYLETSRLGDHELWRTHPTNRHARDKRLVPDFAPIITPRLSITV